jgi:hypothetical protein
MYSRQRRAFGETLLDKLLMRRKLAELIIDVEAAQALVCDGTGFANHRQLEAVRQHIAVPVTKLKVCRLGITAASDAVEIHGGTGYIETWPVARLPRDAQVNTIWEGPDNILCLDVRRGIERSQAHQPLLERLCDAASVSDDDDTTRRSLPGPNSTAGWLRLGCSRSPSSSVTSTPVLCSPSEPPGHRNPPSDGRQVVRAALPGRPRAASGHRCRR